MSWTFSATLFGRSVTPCIASRGKRDADDLEDAELSGKEKPDAVDPIKNESLSILEDLIEQGRHGKLARSAEANPAKAKE